MANIYGYPPVSSSHSVQPRSLTSRSPKEVFVFHQTSLGSKSMNHRCSECMNQTWAKSFFQNQTYSELTNTNSFQQEFSAALSIGLFSRRWRRPSCGNGNGFSVFPGFGGGVGQRSPALLCVCTHALHAATLTRCISSYWWEVPYWGGQWDCLGSAVGRGGTNTVTVAPRSLTVAVIEEGVEVWFSHFFKKKKIYIFFKKAVLEIKKKFSPVYELCYFETSHVKLRA